MSWFLTNLISTILLPPLNLLAMALAGLLLWRRRPRLAYGLLASAFALLWLLSTPFVAESLLHSLEPPALNIRSDDLPVADAIVVIGGGTNFYAPEYGGDTVSHATLQRLRYAARLYRETAKPVLVSGGKPLGNATSEAQQMRSVLEQEFRIPVQWSEEESNNTRENARYSYRLLLQYGIRRIYLVTHAWHMPRARQAFESAGFEVIPAPTVFTTRYQTDLLAWVPSAEALHDSRIYLHEQIGRLWYRLKS
ncbi:MAG TPA: YdcF family protein [Gallionellaceae bacterium]|nr:YdcF family protein [Gallionellaceae bacterium]